MITKVNNGITTLKNLFLEVFLDHTNKVTNVSDGSVLNAMAFGVGKVAQKAIKDVAIVEAQLFPEYATGEYLDKSAALFGVSPRKGALGSSTYVRVYANPGTRYGVGSQFFISKSGVRFETDEVLVVGDSGYGYVHVRSTITGIAANVDANSIVNISPRPLGHIECTNEYYAIGGRDYEDDETFRKRIRNNGNLYSKGTLEYWTQVFQEADDRILRVMNVGLGEDGMTHIYLVTQNGVMFTDEELEGLLSQVKSNFSISEIDLNGDAIGIKLENAKWMIVGGDMGVDFRVELNADTQVSAVRRNIQVALTKYLDFRFWTPGKTVQWDDLLSVVKNASGVKYVPDEFFNPRYDMEVPINQLPRIQGFRMRDLQGNILYDSNQNLSAYFYPASDEEEASAQIGTGITYLASFKVTNTRNNPVPDATISIGSSIVTTDQKGTANIMLENGEYTYSLTKQNWVTRMGQFVILNQPVYITVNDFYAIPYVVTFKVITGLNPVVGALVTVNGEEYSTGADGTVKVSLEPGSYSYTIEKVNYQTINGGFSVLNADILVEEEMFVESMSVGFAAIDQVNSIFVEGAVLSVRNNTATTDFEGQASMDLEIGSYEVDVVRDGYLPFHREFDVDARIQNCVLLELESTPYQITFTVIDNETNKVVPNASIRVNGQTYLTDESGQAICSLVSGSWDYVVFRTGYLKYEGTVVVDGASKSVLVKLSVAYYSYYIVFRDVDNGDYLQGVQVTINGRIYISDVNGQIQAILPNGSYDYIARKANYKDKLGNIVVQDQDEKEIVYMEVRDSVNTITVLDYLDMKPVETASVKIYNKGTGELVQELTTLSNGVAKFQNKAGEYYIIASHPDYLDTPQIDFTLERLKDMNMNVLMDRKTKTAIFEVDEIIPKTASSLDTDESAATANPITNGVSVTVTGLQWVSPNKFETVVKTYVIGVNGQVTADIVPMNPYTIAFVDKGFYNTDTTTHTWKFDVGTDFFRWTVTCIKTLTFNVLQQNSLLPIEVMDAPADYPILSLTGQSRPQRIQVDALGASTFYISPGNFSGSTSQIDHITQSSSFFYTTPPTASRTIYLDYNVMQWKMDVSCDYPVDSMAEGLVVTVKRQAEPTYLFTGTTDSSGSFTSPGLPDKYKIAPGFYTYSFGGSDTDFESNTQTIYFPQNHVQPDTEFVQAESQRRTGTAMFAMYEKYSSSSFPMGTDLLFDVLEDEVVILTGQKVDTNGNFVQVYRSGMTYMFRCQYDAFYSNPETVLSARTDFTNPTSLTMEALISYPVQMKNIIYPSQPLKAYSPRYWVNIPKDYSVAAGGISTPVDEFQMFLAIRDMKVTGNIMYFDNTPATEFNPVEHIGEPNPAAIYLNFTAKKYTVPVTVTESLTGNKAANCPVTVTSKWNSAVTYTGTTDASGNLTLNDVYYGDYTYTIGGTPTFAESTGSISFPIGTSEVSSDRWNASVTYNTGEVSLNLKMTRPGFDTINLTGTSIRMTQGATPITFDTDSSGNATFNAVIGVACSFEIQDSSLYLVSKTSSYTYSSVGANYNWSVTALTYTQVVNITEKNTGDKADNCKFVMTHSQNAAISFTGTTNANGSVTFTGVPFGSYSYTAGEGGNPTYDQITGTVAVPGNSPLNLQVTYNTGQVSMRFWEIIPGFGDQTNGKVVAQVSMQVSQAGTVIGNYTTNSSGYIYFTCSYEVPVTITVSKANYKFNVMTTTHTYHTVNENYDWRVTALTYNKVITVRNSVTDANVNQACAVNLTATHNGVAVSYSGNTSTAGTITFNNVPFGFENWAYTCTAGGGNVFTSSTVSSIVINSTAGITMTVAYISTTFNVTVRQIVPGFGDTTNGQLMAGWGLFSVVQNGTTKTYSANGSGVISITGYVGLPFSISAPYSGDYSNGTQSWTPANNTASTTLKFTLSRKIRVSFTNSVFGQAVTGISVRVTGDTVDQSYSSGGNAYVDIYMGNAMSVIFSGTTDYVAKTTSVPQANTSSSIALEPNKYNVVITAKDTTFSDAVTNVNGGAVKLTSTRKNTVTYSGTTNSSGQTTINCYRTSPYSVSVTQSDFNAGSGTLGENSTALTVNMTRISYAKTVTVQVGGKTMANTSVNLICTENGKQWTTTTNANGQVTSWTYSRGLHWIMRLTDYSSPFYGPTSTNYQTFQFKCSGGWATNAATVGATVTTYYNGTQIHTRNPRGVRNRKLFCLVVVNNNGTFYNYYEYTTVATLVSGIKSQVVSGRFAFLTTLLPNDVYSFADNTTEANLMVNMGNYGQCSIPNFYINRGRWLMILVPNTSKDRCPNWMYYGGAEYNLYMNLGTASPFATTGSNTGSLMFSPTDANAYTWNISIGTDNASAGTGPWSCLKVFDNYNGGLLPAATCTTTYSMGYVSQALTSGSPLSIAYGKMVPGNIAWAVSKSGYLSNSKAAVGLWTSRYQEVSLTRQGMYVTITFTASGASGNAPAGVPVQITGTNENGGAVSANLTTNSSGQVTYNAQRLKPGSTVTWKFNYNQTFIGWFDSTGSFTLPATTPSGGTYSISVAAERIGDGTAWVDPYTATYGSMNNAFNTLGMAFLPVQDIYHRNGCDWGRTPNNSGGYYWSFVLESTYIIRPSTVMEYASRSISSSWQSPVSIATSKAVACRALQHPINSADNMVTGVTMFTSNSFYNKNLPMVGRLFESFNCMYRPTTTRVNGYVYNSTITWIFNDSSKLFGKFFRSDYYKYLNYTTNPFVYTTGILKNNYGSQFFFYVLMIMDNTANPVLNYRYELASLGDFRVNVDIVGAWTLKFDTFSSYYNFGVTSAVGDLANSVSAYNESTVYAVRYMYQTSAADPYIFRYCPMYGLNLTFYCGLTSKTTASMKIITSYINHNTARLEVLSQSSLFPSSILGYNLNHTLGINSLCASPQYPYISACNMEGIAVYPSNGYSSTTLTTPGMLIAYTNTDSHLRWYIWQMTAKIDYNTTNTYYYLSTTNWTDLSSQEPWISSIGATTGYYGVYQIQMNASCTQMIIYQATVDGTIYRPSNYAEQSLPANISVINGTFTFARTSPTGTWKRVPKALCIGNVLDAEVKGAKSCRLFFTDRHPFDYTQVNSDSYKAAMTYVLNVPHMIVVGDYLRTQDYTSGGDRWLMREIQGNSGDPALYMYNVKFSQK